MLRSISLFLGGIWDCGCKSAVGDQGDNSVGSAPMAVIIWREHSSLLQRSGKVSVPEALRHLWCDKRVFLSLHLLLSSLVCCFQLLLACSIPCFSFMNTVKFLNSCKSSLILTFVSCSLLANAEASVLLRYRQNKRCDGAFIPGSRRCRS